MRAEKQATTKVLSVKVPAVRISYGHDGNFVVLEFSESTRYIFLTPEQADQMINSLRTIKAILLRGPVAMPT